VEAVEIDDAYETELESELQIVRDAIVLVASGGARRVVVANLHHARVLVQPARDIAAGVGVALEVLETVDARRLDIAVTLDGSRRVRVAG
jgi:hypothetical protein